MAEATKKSNKPTLYVVQQYNKEGACWTDLVPKGGEDEFYEGVNAQKAISLAMQDYELKEGDFRAIPASSAKVFSPKLKVTERTVW